MPNSTLIRKLFLAVSMLAILVVARPAFAAAIIIDFVSVPGDQTFLESAGTASVLFMATNVTGPAVTVRSVATSLAPGFSGDAKDAVASPTIARDGCTGKTLPIGQFCTFRVSFTIKDLDPTDTINPTDDEGVWTIEGDITLKTAGVPPKTLVAGGTVRITDCGAPSPSAPTEPTCTLPTPEPSSVFTFGSGALGLGGLLGLCATNSSARWRARFHQMPK